MTQKFDTEAKNEAPEAGRGTVQGPLMPRFVYHVPRGPARSSEASVPQAPILEMPPMVAQYLFMLDMVLDLANYLDLAFLELTYMDPTGRQYCLRLFNDLARNFKFVRHIFLGLAALHVYYTSDYAGPENAAVGRVPEQCFLSRYPTLNKHFFSQVAHAHKLRCLEHLRPFMGEQNPEKFLDKTVSEAIVMTSALVCYFIICSNNYKFLDLRLYQTCKSLTSLRELGLNYGLANAPKSVIELYRAQGAKEELDRLKPFPDLLYEILKVQDFEYSKGKVRVMGGGHGKRKRPTPKQVAHPSDNPDISEVKKRLKLAIQSILNAYSDESDLEVEEYEDGAQNSKSFEKSTLHLDLDVSDEYKLSDEELDSEDFLEASELNRPSFLSDEISKIHRDQQRCQNFPTFVLRTIEDGVQKDSLRYEKVYRELLDIIKNIAYSIERIPDKKDCQTGSILFALHVTRNDNICYLIHHKDPRIMVILSYFLGYLSGCHNVWWHESLQTEMEYLRRILGEDWGSWIQESEKMVMKNDWRNSLTKK